MPAQRSRVRGDKGFRKVLQQLPDAARKEMADVMRGIGVELVEIMQADAPKGKTGKLRQSITYKLAERSLRLRVGLITKRRGTFEPFYGRFVEFGRKAQVVNVTRRKGTAPYQMKVRAMAPRPYVYKRRPEVRAILRTRLQNYWSHVLSAAAEGASFDD